MDRVFTYQQDVRRANSKFVEALDSWNMNLVFQTVSFFTGVLALMVLIVLMASAEEDWGWEMPFAGVAILIPVIVGVPLYYALKTLYKSYIMRHTHMEKEDVRVKFTDHFAHLDTKDAEYSFALADVTCLRAVRDGVESDVRGFPVEVWAGKELLWSLPIEAYHIAEALSELTNCRISVEP